MKKIRLPSGEDVLIDDEDSEKVSGYAWRRIKKAAGASIPKEGKNTTIYMHRLIMDAKKGEQIDHRFHNRLDNRKKHLRVCTPAENSRNKRKYKGCLSKYKGVSWHKATKLWLARITVAKKLTH